MGGGTALEEPAPITRDPAQAWALRSLLATEPSVEEKLQKLHSEIKFALKVDNPVRPSSGCRGHVSVPLPPHRSSSLRSLGTLRQSQAARAGQGPCSRGRPPDKGPAWPPGCSALRSHQVVPHEAPRPLEFWVLHHCPRGSLLLSPGCPSLPSWAP